MRIEPLIAGAGIGIGMMLWAAARKRIAAWFGTEPMTRAKRLLGIRVT
jgi:hypothetical protein